MFVRSSLSSTNHVDARHQQRQSFDAKRKLLSREEYENQRHKHNLDYTQAISPLREWLIFCNFCDSVANSSIFSNYIFGCIIIAGFLVGVETFNSLAKSSVVRILDSLVLYSFCCEVGVKLFAEGKAPLLYFIGPDWKWNIFDFTIVLFSLPIVPVATSQIKLLRLIRLMRLAKVFRKIPQLQMIIMGLAGGMESIAYIFVLLFLIFYMFAIAGMIFFRDNNPWHWRSLEVSMMTLLRIATLDGWGDIFYIDYYGCHEYSAGGYYYTMDRALASVNIFGETNRLGSLPALCSHPRAQSVVAVVFYLTLISLCSFCMLSLFIGAVSTAMAASMSEKREKEKEAQSIKERAMLGHQIAKYADMDSMDRKTRRRLGLITSALSGEPLVFEYTRVDLSWTSLSASAVYRWLSLVSQEAADSAVFQNIVTAVIVLAGVLVGIDCDNHLHEALAPYSGVADVVIQSVFSAECAVKIVAEEFKPWKYFADHWNKFDFFVVAAAYIFAYGFRAQGSLIMVLRLLRLLRVLKLMRALPQLQVIVAALMEGISSIGFIAVLIVIAFYFFAIVGMTAFGGNDPWRFSNLWMALFTLLNAATLDGWSQIMYTQLYGCAQVPDQSGCTAETSTPQFVVAVVYWTVFVMMCSFVMLTLFIGVVSMGMEESKDKQDKQKKVDDRAALIAAVEGISDYDIALYKEVFELVDFTDSLLIGKDEMRFGLAVAQISLDKNEFTALWKKVDKDDSDEIDFAEFLEFLMLLRRQMQSCKLSQAENGNGDGDGDGCSGTDIKQRDGVRKKARRQSFLSSMSISSSFSDGKVLSEVVDVNVEGQTLKSMGSNAWDVALGTGDGDGDGDGDGGQCFHLNSEMVQVPIAEEVSLRASMPQYKVTKMRPSRQPVVHISSVVDPDALAEDDTRPRVCLEEWRDPGHGEDSGYGDREVVRGDVDCRAVERNSENNVAAKLDVGRTLPQWAVHRVAATFVAAVLAEGSDGAARHISANYISAHSPADREALVPAVAKKERRRRLEPAREEKRKLVDPIKRKQLSAKFVDMDNFPGPLSKPRRSEKERFPVMHSMGLSLAMFTDAAPRTRCCDGDDDEGGHGEWNGVGDMNGDGDGDEDGDSVVTSTHERLMHLRMHEQHDLQRTRPAPDAVGKNGSLPPLALIRVRVDDVDDECAASARERQLRHEVVTAEAPGHHQSKVKRVPAPADDISDELAKQVTYTTKKKKKVKKKKKIIAGGDGVVGTVGVRGSVPSLSLASLLGMDQAIDERVWGPLEPQHDYGGYGLRPPAQDPRPPHRRSGEGVGSDESRDQVSQPETPNGDDMRVKRLEQEEGGYRLDPPHMVPQMRVVRQAERGGEMSTPFQGEPAAGGMGLDAAVLGERALLTRKSKRSVRPLSRGSGGSGGTMGGSQGPKVCIL